MLKKAVVAGVAVALGFGATLASADHRYRYGHHHDRGDKLGYLLGGAIIGAAIGELVHSNRYDRGYYRSHRGYYNRGYYAPRRSHVGVYYYRGPRYYDSYRPRVRVREYRPYRYGYAPRREVRRYYRD